MGYDDNITLCHLDVALADTASATSPPRDWFLNDLASFRMNPNIGGADMPDHTRASRQRVACCTTSRSSRYSSPSCSKSVPLGSCDTQIPKSRQLFRHEMPLAMVVAKARMSGNILLKRPSSDLSPARNQHADKRRQRGRGLRTFENKTMANQEQ